MKSFIAILAFATVANAGTRIEHDYQTQFGALTLDNACVTATTVESKTPTKHCVKLVPVVRGEGDQQYTDWVCAQYSNSKIVYSRSYTATVCTDLQQIGYGEGGSLECVKYEQVAKFIPTTITVREVTEHGDSSNWPGVSKSFTFPSCN